MIEVELQEIKDYWSKKYPEIEIILANSYENGKYLGRMIAPNCSVDLSANNIDELIRQGEDFLRIITK